MCGLLRGSAPRSGVMASPEHNLVWRAQSSQSRAACEPAHASQRVSGILAVGTRRSIQLPSSSLRASSTNLMSGLVPRGSPAKCPQSLTETRNSAFGICLTS